MQLAIKDLKIRAGEQVLVDIPQLRTNFSSLALMGTSGSGKSTLIKAILGDNDPGLTQTGTVCVQGAAGPLRLGREIRVIPQSPQNALDPYRRVRQQVVEAFDIIGVGKDYSLRGFAQLCGIDKGILNSYPCQLSGGQVQRIICGLALVGRPQLIIADEPTSALDTAGRAAFMELIAYGLKQGISLILATHDLAMAGQLCSQTIRITKGKINAQPSLPTMSPAFASDANVEVSAGQKKVMIAARNLAKSYYQHKFFHTTHKTIFQHGNFTIYQGETVGIVGKNGTGKTTLINILLGLLSPSAGEVEVKDKISVVFQNSRTAVDPKYSVEQVLQEARPGISRQELQQVLMAVGLGQLKLQQRALALSGGQLQRVCIARAVLQQAKIICFDEAFSGLDELSQQHVWGLLTSLKKRYGLTYLFITHAPRLMTKMDYLLALEDQTIQIQPAPIWEQGQEDLQ